MADKEQTTKINELRPLSAGLTLTVKVVDAKIVQQKSRIQGRFAECLVGDETGIIVLNARNDQVGLAKEGNTLLLSNARIDMFKGSMRLAVDRTGRIDVLEPASFPVDQTNNLSLIEFARVDVVV